MYSKILFIAYNVIQKYFYECRNKVICSKMAVFYFSCSSATQILLGQLPVVDDVRKDLGRRLGGAGPIGVAVVHVIHAELLPGKCHKFTQGIE